MGAVVERHLYLVPPPLHYPSGIADLRVRSAILRHVALVLDYTGGRKHWAAEELDIDPVTLWRWVRGEVEPHGLGQHRMTMVVGSRRNAAP